MRILHAYNQHRGGGGANNATRATIEVSRRAGVDIAVFARSSNDVPQDLLGRIRAGINAICESESVDQFRAIVDSFRPDVVHVHNLFPLVSPWILPYCRRRGIPVVMSCVDYRMTCPVVTHLHNHRICTHCTGGREYWAVFRNCRQNLAESVAMSLYNVTVRKLRLFQDNVNHFIAPSEFTRQWLIDHAAIEPTRISTIAPVVDIPPTAADPAAGGYVAFAGRFVYEKGIDTFLEAARLCPFPFRMARNENSLVSMEIPANVDAVVTRNRAELDAFYRGARMVVVPSIWFETFGLVGAEAMSHGIPSVASRIGAVSCLVEDGVDGLFFEPGNAQDLADKISRLWADPVLCRQYGQAARRKAASLWCAERHFENLRTLYEELNGRPRELSPLVINAPAFDPQKVNVRLSQPESGGRV